MTPPHDIIDRLFPALVTIGCIGSLIIIAIIGGIRVLVS